LAALGITGFSFAGAAILPKMTDTYAISVLSNTIQLDGVLFGFTAVMFGFFYSKGIIRRGQTNLLFLVITSFFIYYLSLAFAFFLLGDQSTDGLIVGPALMAVIGGFLSSVMVVRALAKEQKPDEKINPDTTLDLGN